MKKILRKGETYIGIQYRSGGFSNNLYCSTSLDINENRKTLELDFSKISKAQIKTSSNDDLDDLMENSSEISQIDFSDKQITEILMRSGIKQNEIILVEFISKVKITEKMEIIFLNSRGFKLERK